jgi:hypothetical protein
MNIGAQFFIWLVAWALLCFTLMAITPPPERFWPLCIFTAATFVLGMFFGLWVASASERIGNGED